MPIRGLEKLPQELIIRILECVCESIVKDLSMLDFDRRIPCPGILNQYLQLHLVCRSFHRLLKYYVRVHGMPIRDRLLDLQMIKFTNMLETISTIGRLDSENYISLVEIETILNTSGGVCRNAGFFDITPQLFGVDGCLSDNAALFIMARVPQVFRDRLVTTAEDGEECDKAGIGLASSDNDDAHDIEEQEYYNVIVHKLANTLCFNNPVHKRMYKMKYFRDQKPLGAGIEIVVGRYRFPFILPIRLPKSDILPGFWIGISILSLTDKKARKPLDREKVYRGEEGRYWLWLIPNYKYILVDYETSVILVCEYGPYADPYRYSLARYGVEYMRGY